MISDNWTHLAPLSVDFRKSLWQIWHTRWQTNDWAIARIKLKPTELSTWTRQPVPMISEHSAHLTPLSVDFRTWLWRYTYLLLLISMLCKRYSRIERRQVVFLKRYSNQRKETSLNCDSSANFDLRTWHWQAFIQIDLIERRQVVFLC